eukprot:CAMPEP_0205919232 /NCGR_PEP_ID=MMETSP1325-20131115/10310_1 /ASSEMBLY_ACC=CAM_ASM_000708 /TAXON_ID=236786 /ORGANISM="Florenciella sp., Strain RCC1007" /LENGTH=184 /DNA_ID=CAMNT_0053286817 /DNA_START=22 /DNA_END=576 /DNA_ORIENTATION=+
MASDDRRSSRRLIDTDAPGDGMDWQGLLDDESSIGRGEGRARYVEDEGLRGEEPAAEARRERATVDLTEEEATRAAVTEAQKVAQARSKGLTVDPQVPGGSLQQSTAEDSSSTVTPSSNASNPPGGTPKSSEHPFSPPSSLMAPRPDPADTTDTTALMPSDTQDVVQREDEKPDSQTEIPLHSQ